MTTHLIDDRKYKLPECWDDTTYSQYVALLSTGNNLSDHISLFTGIPKKELYKAEMNAEKISLALSFLTIPPQFKPKPSPTVGPYRLKDSFIKMVGQYDDLRQLLTKAPSPVLTIEDNLLVADMYLEACAIYTTKIKYGTYDSSKVMDMKEELKQYSAIEVLQTGGFFLFWVAKAQQPNQLN